MKNENVITFNRPDDWHLHVRDGDVLAAVIADTSRDFGRAIIMPNLPVPITTRSMAAAYRAEILNQLFDLIEEFYLTRIYGNFNCEKFIDLNQLEKKMQLSKKINSDETCHFEIWKK